MSLPAGLRRRLLLAAMTAGLAAGTAGITYGAFTATTANPSSSFTAGTVTITDNDGGAAMLGLSNALPGNADTSCIKVRYTGSLNSMVRLYATLGGSLTSYLTLTVTRGTDSSPSFDSCAGFTADATNYIGAGAGIVYQGSLVSFPATYAGGIVDPTPGTPETWSQNEEHSYRFVISLQDTDAAKGLAGTAAFTWEARNL